MATEIKTEWQYTPPQHYGEKGVWTPKETRVTVPDKEPYDSGQGVWKCWVIGIVLFILMVWVYGLWSTGGGEPGKCQTELGYNGQSEIVECETR